MTQGKLGESYAQVEVHEQVQVQVHEQVQVH
jgi:hypothetical protein